MTLDPENVSSNITYAYQNNKVIKDKQEIKSDLYINRQVHATKKKCNLTIFQVSKSPKEDVKAVYSLVLSLF